MAKACEECTQNCLMMHKKHKNPDRVTTSFFKVMFGDDYSKILFLPPRFASREQDMVGETTKLEDLNGVKWEVKFTKVDGVLAFQEGWNKFALAHKLKLGDFLVFHYIKKSYFVVLMYGQSGCPENRHFGFPHQQTKEANMITNVHSPSNVNTNGRNFCRESSSESERSVHGVDENNKIKKNGNNAKVTPNVNTNTNTHLLAQPGTPGSDKERGQGSEPLVRSTSPDNTVSETPTTVKPLCLVDNDNGHAQEECAKSVLQLEVVEFDGGRENIMVARGGLEETKSKDSQKSSETRLEMSTEKRKASTVMQYEATHNNSSNKRSKNTNVPISPATRLKKEPDTSCSRLPDAAKQIKSITKEPSSKYGSVGLIEKKPKPEPVDDDETPPAYSSNTSFSAVMRNYKYIELPNWVKLDKGKQKSNVILLRNGRDLWAVLYQSKYGLKVLTQSWGVFAKERGIKPGDTCEFVLERDTSNVFNVHVTSS